MSTTIQPFPDWLKSTAAHVETILDEFLPEADIEPVRLHEAMRYSVLGGGKRVRAALVYAAGEASAGAGQSLSSAQAKALDHASAAVELIHAYSLVHDDLPCMDNDDLRRGRPTTHRQFDEATAMLAGDALQPLAFELLAQTPVAPALVIQAVELLARSAGSLGMAGGQAIDCLAVGQALSQAELQVMHSMKTGAMLQASVLLGGIVVGAGSATREGLERYASAMGLAFQVADDILDVTADTAVLGKTAGKDLQNNKPTYVSLLGVDGARGLLESLRKEAHSALLPLGPAGHRLGELADYIVGRDH
ncbi:MAG: polyprenyl synthetase family protein [Pusillimonas sp.]